ncbi:MAG: aldo/keto reductase family oxidoreductase, partial [Bacteroidota bacterium]
QKIYLSDSGPKVSPAIYGFYRWSDEDLSQHKMESILNLCLELGVNTFDHADVYGGYHCEELFGKIIKSKALKREDLVLFTKAGYVTPHYSHPDIKVPHYNSSGTHLLNSLDRSLKQLHTDYVDVFLVNNLDPISDLEETARTLEKIKSSGKAKNIGIVNFSVFQHQLLSSYLRIPIVTNHIELNLLNTTALDNGQIDYSKQRYMRPLATSPLAEGRIAESSDRVPLRVRGKLEELSKKYDVHFESLAIAWLVKLGALPLIGTTNENRIRNIVAAFDINLEHQDWYDLYNCSRAI